jgi:hypothetical protein
MDQRQLFWNTPGLKQRGPQKTLSIQMKLYPNLDLKLNEPPQLRVDQQNALELHQLQLSQLGRNRYP